MLEHADAIGVVTFVVVVALFDEGCVFAVSADVDVRLLLSFSEQ